MFDVSILPMDSCSDTDSMETITIVAILNPQDSCMITLVFRRMPYWKLSVSGLPEYHGGPDSHTLGIEMLTF